MERNGIRLDAGSASAIIEQVSDAITTHDLAGVIVECNRAAILLYGYDRTELVGRNGMTLIPGRCLEAELHVLERALVGATVDSYVSRRLCKDGSVVDVRVRLATLRDIHGMPTGVSSIVHRAPGLEAADNLEAAQDAGQLDEIRRRFVTVASHELRTPLTAIAGFAATMVELWSTMPDQQKQQCLSIMNEQSQRMVRLVDDLLTISRLDEGKIDSQGRRTLVCDSVQQALRELPARVLVEGEIDLDLAVAVAADQLQQILVNYLSNAIKYGEQPIIVHVSRDGDDVILCVEDHGRGVPEEFVPHLFERFARYCEHRDIEGTGLGLSIVQGLARANGGAAWHEPVRPRGAAFYVRLPTLTAE